jgi:hypothetical protein
MGRGKKKKKKKKRGMEGRKKGKPRLERWVSSP